MTSEHGSDNFRPTLDSELRSASETLETSTDKSTDTEKCLNITGDVVEKVKDTTQPYIDVSSDFGKASIDLLHSELENFPSSCDVLFKALDAASEVHPFVKVAVLAFKAAINFELTRRSNDRRIFALHVEMKDTMSVLTILRRLAKDDRGSDGKSVEDRLRDRMIVIARDIKQCAETCDAMSKKKLILKVFKSVIWEGKLEAFATCFSSHRSALQQDLAMHASLRIENANEKLDVVLLFRQLQSPAERDLWKYIQSEGGPQKFLESDTLMAELRKRVPEDNNDWVATKSELVTELKTDIMEAMDANQKVFSRKFEAQQTILLEEMESHMSREGDRIIQAIRGGAAYERIVDPDVYELWKEMGWKGHVKAKHFVMAIREYFFERMELSTVDSIERTLDFGPPVDSSGTTAAKSSQDKWALRYINVTRLRPLMEALDDDASTFVTVKEVNSFTKARPIDWSLPKWMAYWSSGFPLTLRYYYDRCQSTLAQMDSVAQNVLPANRGSIDQFLAGVSLNIVHFILGGLRDTWEETPHLNAVLFERFKEHVDHEENSIRKVLQNLVYNLDGMDTVTMVLGQGRPEKRVIHVLYLLLDRCLEIIKVGCTVIIHRNELSIIGDSIAMLLGVIWARIKGLEALFKLQGLDVKEQFRKFAFGMYYYVNHESDLNPYGTKRDTGNQSGSDATAVLDTSDSPADGIAESLYYGPDPDELDLEAYKHPPSTEASPEVPNTEQYWRGLQDVHSVSGMMRAFGLVELEDATGVGGSFSAKGFNVLHDYNLHGQRQGDIVVFHKEHTDQRTLRWRYEGTLDASSNTISGRYAMATSLDDALDRFIIPADCYIGQFAIARLPLHRFGAMNCVQDLLTPAPRDPKDLWHIAYDAVVQGIRARAGHISWSVLRERRARRRRFLELYTRYEESEHVSNISTTQALSADEYAEMAQLQNTSPESDLRFYRSLGRLMMRSQVKHEIVFCDGCDTENLRNTRFVCLDCWNNNGEVTSVDICTQCARTDFKLGDDGAYHRTWHALLQLRRSVPCRRLRTLITSAKDVQEKVAGQNGALECLQCAKQLERPYWACVDCHGKTAICADCNTKNEENWLSVFMLRDQSSQTTNDVAHNWLHTLVQLQCPQAPTAPPPSLDERLLTIEQRLKFVESAIQALHAIVIPSR